MVLSVVVAVAIQLATGGVVSAQPPEIVGQGRSDHTSYTAYVIRYSLHWVVLLPLLVSFICGLVCILISSRRTI